VLALAELQREQEVRPMLALFGAQRLVGDQLVERQRSLAVERAEKLRF